MKRKMYAPGENAGGFFLFSVLFVFLPVSLIVLDPLVEYGI